MYNKKEFRPLWTPLLGLLKEAVPVFWMKDKVIKNVLSCLPIVADQLASWSVMNDRVDFVIGRVIGEWW